MDISDHFVWFLVRERLDYAREQARRRSLVPPPTRRSLRKRLGATLVALGQALLEETAAPRRVTP
jgi:hypothetical protein